MSEEQLVDLSTFESADPALSTRNNQQNKYEKPAFLPKGKDQVWPIIGRFLINPIRSEAQYYHEVHDHNIQVGGRWLNVPCYKTKNQKCPFCEAYWAARDAEKKLVAKGADGANAPDSLRIELKKAQVIKKMMEQRRRFGMLMTLPKDPTVYMFFATKSLIDEIFGNKDKGTKGAFYEFQNDYKVPVFQPKEATGWLSLNKTGEKLDTKYTAKPSVVQVIEGRVKTEKLHEEGLHPDVLRMCEAGQLPRVKAYYEGRFWSLEEMENFVASEYTQVPERYAKFIPQDESKPVARHIDSGSMNLPPITEAIGGNLSDSDEPEINPF